MSGSAPFWVSYVSVLALVVSAVTAFISFLTYRANGPRLTLRTTYVSADPVMRRVTVEFVVVNRGRADVAIQGFRLTPYGTRHPVLTVDAVEGPTLPFRLESSAREKWRANVLSVAREYDASLRSKRFNPRSSWPTHFFFSVEAGNGKVVHAKAQHYDARALIADAFPSAPSADS